MSGAQRDPSTKKIFILLVAPNLSSKMGGEALKALRIYQEILATGISACQITHDRVKAEMDESYPDLCIHYIHEDFWQTFFYRSWALRFLQKIIFYIKAKKLAENLMISGSPTVVHFTSPISPLEPVFPVTNAFNVIGPINGNIHYPKVFRAEGYLDGWWKEPFYAFAAGMFRYFFPFKKKADVFLVSGGERTIKMIEKTGVDPKKICRVIDSGVATSFLKAPRIEHRGTNFRFVFVGNFVKCKAIELAVKSLARTVQKIELDIVGNGPERNRLLALVNQLELQQRVRFIPWIQNDDLPEALKTYRGFVFPSLREANGIVVQESLALGLPAVCLKWGGPAEIVSRGGGVLIEPRSREYVVQKLAETMDRLAVDDAWAEKLSLEGRKIAEEEFCWDKIIRKWLKIFVSAKEV